jgi:hypothetical protein
VDLTKYQSPVKPQGDRDTCGSFASIAALEAAYRRSHGLALDLSEQYLNHWAQQFSAVGSNRPVPWNETNAGSIGGGGFARPLSALQRGLGVPPEAVLPYVPTLSYQNADAGDLPSLNDWSLIYTQHAIDDFNLSDVPAPYVFSPPDIVSTTIMPQAAFSAARYRATGVTYLSPTDINDENAYRRVLAGGREVILEFRCCHGDPGDGSTKPWRLPPLSNGGPRGHVMLIVGYDDSKQMFRVKNSWGTNWADQGYAWVSYDFVRRAAVGAAYLHGVTSPTGPFNTFSHSHFFLGRWQLDFDGWKGELDIYNLP